MRRKAMSPFWPGVVAPTDAGMSANRTAQVAKPAMSLERMLCDDTTVPSQVSWLPAWAPRFSQPPGLPIVYRCAQGPRLIGGSAARQLVSAGGDVGASTQAFRIGTVHWLWPRTLYDWFGTSRTYTFGAPAAAADTSFVVALNGSNVPRRTRIGTPPVRDPLDAS